MSEKSVCQAWASVMIYDEQQKKWKPAGTSSGIARVCIYKREPGPLSYRVVGRKENDHEVVINCSIIKNLKYNKATMTFHQWRDARTVYGLNFRSPDDAETFAQGMEAAISQLSGGGSMQAEEDGRRIEQQRLEEEKRERERQEAERQKRERERQEAERRERERQARERASSAASSGSAPPPAPAAPPPPPAPPAPPPPPPAPTPAPAPSGGGGGGGGGPMDMASALSAVKLKKADPVDEKPASGGGGGGGFGGGGGDFMGELQKRMAAKRANKSGDSSSKPSSGPSQSIRAEPKRPAWQKSTSQSGSSTLGAQNSTDRSPTVGKRFSGGTTTNSNRVGSTNSLNGNSGDLESLKQEILTEVRTEIRKMKEEIISAIRQELSNR